MTTSDTGRAQVSIDINAAPEAVYDLVADLPGMGRWSPEATGGRWLDGLTEAQVGARFRGWNKRGPLRYYTTCRITAADRGRLLEWENDAAGLSVARWRYEFQPNGSGGTTVTESTDDRRGRLMRTLSPVVMGIKDRRGHNLRNMQVTLERLKAAAERQSSSS